MRRFGVVTEDEKEARDDWYLAKQIAVGILIAAAIMFVGFHLYLYIALRAAGQVAHEATQQLQQELQTEGERSKAALRSQADARRKEAERRAAAELELRRALATQTQAEADRAKAEQANAEAKERAWQQFYKPPKKCTDPPDWDTQVECGNAHIKAKKEFEVRWASGQL